MEFWQCMDGWNVRTVQDNALATYQSKSGFAEERLYEWDIAYEIVLWMMSEKKWGGQLKRLNEFFLPKKRTSQCNERVFGFWVLNLNLNLHTIGNAT